MRTCMFFSCVSLTSKRKKTSLVRLLGKPDHTCNVKLTPNLSSVGRNQNNGHVFFPTHFWLFLTMHSKYDWLNYSVHSHTHGQVWRHAVTVTWWQNSSVQGSAWIIEEPGRQEYPDVCLGGWTLLLQKVSLWRGMFLVPNQESCWKQPALIGCWRHLDMYLQCLL